MNELERYDRAQRRYQEWFRLGDIFWNGAEPPEGTCGEPPEGTLGDPAPLVKFFDELAALPEQEQRDFFLEVAATHDDAARATVEDGIALATDFYPRMDAGYFASFVHLINAEGSE
jgi:hypothetical protein